MLVDDSTTIAGDCMECLAFVPDGTPMTGGEIVSRLWVRLWWPATPRVIRRQTLGLSSVCGMSSYLGTLRNRHYVVMLIGKGDKAIRRSYTAAAHFHWPLTKPDECQTSSTSTHPDDRDTGLATAGLTEVMRTCAKPGRRFWYVSRAANSASVSVCKKAGFSLVGGARRTRRMGTSLLGQLIIDSEESSF